ncbi:hypothetical protein [Exiguobacterium sp. s193]|uniref:hypothetical protein n=1 Tax=Exiguobacterium sp. s193 TaxID=2751207 RepID=UPI001BE717A9|nr:hypothetical protein [Exiguobacterium sp. s193]
MEKALIFISSNYRSLYVEDIYRALALPKKFVIQYRYQLEHIDKHLLDDLESKKDRVGVIYYSYDSENEYKGTIEDCREKVFLPIRKVIIKGIEKKEEMGQINFYLELGDFINSNLNVSDNNTERKNVFETCIKLTKVTWRNKIEEVEPYFEKDVKFLHIEKIKGYKYEMNYSFIEKRTNLELKEDSSYTITFLTYDKSEGKGVIKIETDKSHINLNDTLEKGAKINSKKVTFDTRSIDFKRDRTYIVLEDEKSKYSIRLFITLKKRFRKSLAFGGLSTFVLLGFQLSNLIVKGQGQNINNLLSLSFLAIIVGLCIAILHFNFNKK